MYRRLTIIIALSLMFFGGWLVVPAHAQEEKPKWPLRVALATVAVGGSLDAGTTFWFQSNPRWRVYEHGVPYRWTNRWETLGIKAATTVVLWVGCKALYRRYPKFGSIFCTSIGASTGVAGGLNIRAIQRSEFRR